MQVSVFMRMTVLMRMGDLSRMDMQVRMFTPFERAPYPPERESDPDPNQQRG